MRRILSLQSSENSGVSEELVSNGVMADVLAAGVFEVSDKDFSYLILKRADVLT